MAGPRVTLEVGNDGVGIITLVNPPVNALHPDVLRGLKTSFDEAHRRSDVQAIVVRGASGKFCAGMDIGAIVQFQAKGDPSVLPPVSFSLMTDTIEAGPKPVVAAVEGLALGGGLELAMACHGRVAAPNAQLGLVELNLGIIPGFGGTQRLPRLVGLQKAIEMMLLSKPIKSQEAKELGLVDDLAPPGDLLGVARKHALDIAARRRPWLRSLYRTDKLDSLADAREIIKFARQQAKQTAPNVDHPQKCLDAIEEGIVAGGAAGNIKEDTVFKELVFSNTAKALTHIFFAQRATTKVPGVTDQGLKPRSIQKVAVIGGGLMGSGIATALILSGIQVLLKEVNSDYLQAGLKRIKANLTSRVKKGKMSEDKFQKTLSLVKGVLDYSEFGMVDLVIEAVIESIPLKQQIFSELEKVCSPQCVLSSNTSTIDLNVVGAKTSSQDRIIGAHFFSPAHVMPLLEIVRTEKTSPQVILDLLNAAKAIKKTPVVVGNCTGFAVNRVFFPYTMAACLIADLGVDPYRIDRIIKAFGMPMGPFRLADLVGMGVALAVGQQFRNAFPDRSYAARIILMMMEDKRLGMTVLTCTMCCSDTG
eukprot:TRINITY_DN11176_c0_g1_i2.p1 TRINITY_DN11176_c0_g1~~TRINITY_DN11176_c0_g1_i2.p1  ORF type:complete len:589 (+),score=127.43 TRINITY_DN11176_c0_g1_i2:90-1856(+)